MSNATIQEYQNRLRDALGFIGQLKSKLETLQRTKNEPIAIVGMGCRFPGGSTTPESFFHALETGTDAVGRVPETRWASTALPDDYSAPRWAGLLDSIADFDAKFFEISPREAELLDPQQRILLEVVWEALENAGQPADRLKGSRTGVFVGISAMDYQHRCFAQTFDQLDGYAVTGNLMSTAAGRISFLLGLQGPCISVDTACSSSLVAIDLACHSLRQQEVDLVICGGVNAILSPVASYLLTKLNALSPDGRCKSFDARANGYVRSEGCGIVILKRLSDAERDGDRILALIRASGINQDGRSTGLTTPNVLAQEALIRQVLASAKLSAQDIGYIETHGTGTPLGDPIEIDALRGIFGDLRADASSCILGAVKTNLGHLEAAAGVAGLIKTVQILRHDVIPKNLHFKALNPRISLDGTPLKLATTNLAWPRGDKVRRAGVSSFGLSGTNAHVILEEAPAESQPRAEKKHSAYLLPLSAKHPDALSALAQSYAEWFSTATDALVHDAVYTASARRTHHEHRLAVVARTREEMAQALAGFAKGEMPAGTVRGSVSPQGPPRVVFVFPGQGSQWLGMGRQLLAEEPVFRATLESCADAIKNEAGFSILEQIAANEDSSRLSEIDVIQPLLFCIEIALAALWRSWGVEPDCVIGHSMGEVAAAHIAGILPLEEAIRIICRRSHLMKRIRGQGAMALVELPMADAEAALAGYDAQLSTAVSNGPRSTVLSGDPQALERVLATLEAKGVFCRRIKVDVASHSPQVEPLLGDLIAALREVKPISGKIPMRSTVTGRALTGPELTAHYWADNLRQPVRFSQVIRDLIGEGYLFFLELSPHPILLPAIEENLDDLGVAGAATPSMRRQTNERQTMLEALGSFQVRGGKCNWNVLYPENGHVVSLPTYPWQRERFWIEEPAHGAASHATTTDFLHDAFYAVEWRPAPIAAVTPQFANDGSWILFLDDGGVGESLAALLEAQGQTCLRVRAARGYSKINPRECTIDLHSRDDYFNLLNDALGRERRCAGIVYLFALDSKPLDETTNAALEDEQSRGFLGITYLIQALHRHGRRNKPKLHVLTRGTVAVAEEPVASPIHAPVWGLGRTIALENADIVCKIVDLEPQISAADSTTLLQELPVADDETQVAWRNGQRFAARLVHKHVEPASPHGFTLRADATYLITGGLGGLGISVAEWMVTAGARHLVLLSRKGASEEARELIHRLERDHRAQVRIMPVDVSHFDGLASVFREITTNLPPLCGIVHAAGVAGDSTPLLELEAETFWPIIAAKVRGTWNLHLLSRELPLDFFVVYSSASSIFGLIGQASYAAANAFLDALASWRVGRGQTCMSIQWGPFTTAGMMRDDAARQRIAGSGMTALSPVNGIEALSRLLEHHPTNVAVMKFSPRQWLDMFPHLAAAPYLRELFTSDVSRRRNNQPSDLGLRQALAAAPANERSALLERHVRTLLGQVLRLAPERIEPRAPFQTLGVDSLMSLELRNRLETSLGLKLSATLLFTYAHLEALNEFILSELNLTLGAEVERINEQQRVSITDPDEPIAIVGYACRFPGGGSDPEHYWQALMAGVDAVREVIPARWPSGTIPEDKPGVGYAALLDDIDRFDASFFGISPREAEALDPQQRMLLEITWEALENAGELPTELAGSNTGVFIGITALDYQRIIWNDPTHLDAYGATGTMLSTVAGRLSYVLGLQGPAVALDTACSSSLVAIHLACQSLRHGESTLAIAGGANALLAWQNMVMLSAMQALSPDGRCKTLDARANGYVRGEGCGIIVLKKLSDAQRDGNRILALIRGSAINQDGRSTGLTAPNVLAQQRLLQQALRSARVAPDDIDYVEMHGTGTSLGDPIEADALLRVLGKPRPDGSSCVLGAAKTNIGHLESASGVAGLIKMVESLRHEVIPPNLHFRALNPRINFDGTPFVIPTSPTSWPRGNRSRRGGVSSFGLSGTNAHVILEEAPPEPQSPPEQEQSGYLLPLSAKHPDALFALARSYAEWFSSPNDARLHDLIYTARTRRTHHEHRLAVAARTRDEFAHALAGFAKEEMPSGVVRGSVSPHGAPRVVFVFSGQGSQWAEMGKKLLDEEPVFRAKLQEISAFAERFSGLSLLNEITAPEGASRLNETEIAQPALFALQVALAEQFKSWGILPEAVIGHSVGELAAAHIAGVLTLENAVRLVLLRGRIMQKATGHGKMVWAALPAEDALQLIGTQERRVAIGAINDPFSVVLSGDTEAVDLVTAELEKRGIAARPLRVNYAFHSPQMEPLARELVAEVGRLDPQAAMIGIYSTVTGAKIDGITLDADYWGRNIRATVRFTDAVLAALDDGFRAIVEISPHPVLLANIQQCITTRQVEAQVVPTLRRKNAGRTAALETVGALYASGHEIQWEKLGANHGRVVSLPAYPWQRQRYWIEDISLHPSTQEEPATDPLHDILFELKWECQGEAIKEERRARPGHWLLLLDRGGTGDDLARQLAARNEPCIFVRAGDAYAHPGENEYVVNPESADDYRRLLDEAFDETTQCRGIVNLFALDATPWSDSSEKTLDADFRRNLYIGSYLTRAILTKVWRARPAIYWVTRGAQAVPTSQSLQSPTQTPLWAIARSLILEYPELEVIRVDLAASADNDGLRLAHELGSDDGEDQIALRDDGRYVPRLVHTQPPATNSHDVALQPEASYLIAEGLSPRGLAIAKWMQSQGARQILITGSRPPTEQETAEINALRESGVNVSFFEIDLARQANVQQLLDAVESGCPRLRGIVVDVDNGRKQRLDTSEHETIAFVLRRMLIAWNLHTATTSRALEFFVLSSSAAAILGFAGQLGYAASHAFLDAVAHVRHTRGLAATSIQWGTFVDENPDAPRSANSGLTLQQGVAIFARMIAEPRTEIAAMHFDARQMVQTFPQLAQSHFLAHLANAARAPKKERALVGQFFRTMNAAPDVDKLGLLVDHLREQLGSVLRQEPSTVPIVAPFQTLGVDSLMSLEVRNRLEASLGLELPATLLFTYTTVEQLGAYILDKLRPSLAFSGMGTKDASPALRPIPSPHADDEPIAVVGMACRFPASGDDPESFWHTLSNGVDAVREAQPARWPMGTIPEDKLGAGYAALLDDIDKFDAAFFGISPREAESLDPQHRMLLEVTWNALEHGGIRPDELVGSKTGVFVGCATLDYQRVILSTPNHLDAYGVTGTMLATAAGRISYIFGLQGAAIALDTACSSSLVAIHLGCQSLRNRESNLVIAGGVNALLAWDVMVAMATMRALSPDGRCKTLDSRANGYVRGEGCGMVILKRLSDAERDGDRILALVRGTAINQDGRSTGLTAPNVLAQQDVLRQALGAARLAPEQIGYVEMHGTGTPLGDPIEADALREVLGAPRADGSSCVLGAVKTNIGHLEGAAGVAGFIKIVQIFQHDLIPKNLHFRALNPRVSFEGTPLVIAAENLPWPRKEQPRRAGVSSFGLSGTNAHVILEEAPPALAAQPSHEESAYLLPLSAKNPAALTTLAQSYAEWFTKPNDASLRDIVYTASVRRMHHEHRLAVVARTREEFANACAAYARGEIPAGAAQGRVSDRGPARVVFVFPGQGSQWLGMGRQLLAEEPAFRAVIEACDAPMRIESGFSLLEQMGADEGATRLAEIDVVQPMLFAIEVALAATWKSWGVAPDCVVGHSMGEVAAAHIAGILSLGDAIRIICRRSKLLKRISGQGAMALVELPMEETEAALAGYETSLSVAVSNGPRSSVVSGDPAALERLIGTLESRGVFCRRVKVDVASHSPQVDPLLADLLDSLRDVKPVSGHVAMRSTVTGGALLGPELVASYWTDNLRRPVRFSKVVSDLIREGHDFFLEMSPHPILLPSIDENLKNLGVAGSACPSMRRQTNERQTMLEALGSLHVLGGKLNWGTLYPDRGRIVSLPHYPWQRERFWVEAPKTQTCAMHKADGHPLLGQGFVPASQSELHVWEQWLSVEDIPYLADHCVQGEVVFPGAGYAEMALATAKLVYGEGNTILEEITFDRMLALPKNEGRIVQISLREEGGGRAAVTISSKQEGAKDWVQHSVGHLRVMSTSTEPPEALDRATIQSRCSEVVTSSAHYEEMTAHGLSYGNAFQGVAEIHVGTGEIVAEIRLKDDELDRSKSYEVHPALLDACFQASSWAIHSADAKGTFVPIKVSGLRMYERPGRSVWIHARRKMNAPENAAIVSFIARDESGRVLFEIEELHSQALDSASTSIEDPYENCIFNVEWRNAELPPTVDAPSKPNSWLILMDRHGLGGAVAEQLRQQGDRVVQISPSDVYSRLSEDSYALNPSHMEHWERALSTAFGKTGLRAAIHCGALDGATWQETTSSTLMTDIRHGPLSVLRLTQALLKQGWRDVPRLYVLTRAAQAVGATSQPIAVAQAMIWGMGRTIATEQPDLGCFRIDLPPEANGDEPAFVVRELNSGSDEDQIALRSQGRYVARLVRGSWKRSDSANERREPARGRAYRLETRAPGVLENLALRLAERRSPAPGEVEIEVEAAGLNFLDVMKAMGIYPGMDKSSIQLGGECSGRISALGPGVTNFHVGQAVIASATSCFASHVIARVEFVVAKPERLSFEEATTIPGVFMTAFWALHHVGRLRRGERVLIHSASGGMGLAAVQYARAIGAEIFATAGSEDKRAYLRSIGIEHVMDSRSTSFADDVLAKTKRRGVDVVLNSLTGDALVRSLEILAPYGRFLEVGKKDIYENSRLGLLPFRKSLSYTAIDLAAMAEERPEDFGLLFKEVVSRFEDGTFQPEPMTIFSVNEVHEAFRLMARAKHIGKIVVRMREENVLVSVHKREELPLHADATYLITGGLGGLGLSVAQWMVDQGVKNLALVGRSDPTPRATMAIEEMRSAGANVHTLRANVGQTADVEAMVAHIEKSMPPLRGIVHAAGVLADRTIPDLDEAQFQKALEPKVLGGWNLHAATRETPLDFFVMYSSGAGLLGSAGQANYAAANAFLDALAHGRDAQGLAGTSIQWGTFSDVGLAAASDIRGNRMVTRGGATFKPEEGTLLLGRVLTQAHTEVGIMHFDIRQWMEFYPHVAGSPFFADLVRESGGAAASKGGAFKDELERAAPLQRSGMIEMHLVEQLGKVLRLEHSKIDHRAPFASLGMDSLMSLELRNRLEASLGIKLSAALLFTYSTTVALAKYLLERIFPTESPPESLPKEVPVETGDPAGTEAESLFTQPEDESALVDKLGEFEEFLK